MFDDNEDRRSRALGDDGIPVTYTLLNSQKLEERLRRWARQYPDLILVDTAQRMFGLPKAGTSDDCPYEEGNNHRHGGCSNYVFTIQDFVAHPEGSKSSARLPEIFWSGALHGDQRLGPTIVMETATILLEAAMCEARPFLRNKYNANAEEIWEQELVEAELCRQRLVELGIDDEHRQWLARLVSTRRIIVVPSANALGFFRDEQKEGLVDPDKDFAYSFRNGNNNSTNNEDELCMQTVAARTVNEIFRDHMFQIALSFHSGDGGMESSWGVSPNQAFIGPDQRAQQQLVAAYNNVVIGSGLAIMQRSSGAGGGPIDEDVFFSEHGRGNTEEWAYAASWNLHHSRSCTPTTYGGYPREKTIYNNASHRAVTMLVSTKIEGHVANSGLGSVTDLFPKRHSGDNEHLQYQGDSYIPRSIRLALLSADIVQPYVSIFGINNVALSDDIVPLFDQETSCFEMKAVAVPQGMNRLLVEWTVGGSIHIADTEIWYAKLDEVFEDVTSCHIEPHLISGFRQGIAHGETSGDGYFATSGPKPHPRKSFMKHDKVLGPVFRAEVDVEDFKLGDRIVLIAGAKVDQDWKENDENLATSTARKSSSSTMATLGPQSHLVNARTNQNWQFENAGNVIRGRLSWYSVPMTVVLTVPNEDKNSGGAYEVFDRFGRQTHTKSLHDDDDVGMSVANHYHVLRTVSVLLFCASIAFLLIVIVMMKRRKERVKIRTILQAEMKDEKILSQLVAKPSLGSDLSYYPAVEELDEECEIIDFQDVPTVSA